MPKNQITRIIGIDPYNCSFNDLHKIISKLHDGKRAKLFRFCQRCLIESDIGINEEKHVVMVRFLMALLPESLDEILNLLQSMYDRTTYEIHFTVFCYLDRVLDICKSKRVLNKILVTISEYFLIIETNTASAAWMAGDLLGDHWLTNETFKILLNSAKRARFVPGRMGALHGLQMRLENSSLNHKQIISYIMH
ncbi:MAG: hypothetical protein ABIE07_05460 [Candidatus Zixiibacteriota bacterium]